MVLYLLLSYLIKILLVFISPSEQLVDPFFDRG